MLHPHIDILIPKTPKSILFLDFDGVLIPDGFSKTRAKLWAMSDGLIKSHDQFGKIFNHECIHALNRVIECAECDIVISSSFRKKISGEEAIQIQHFQSMFNFRQIKAKIIGITPTIWAETIRGMEIKEFLDAHPEFEGIPYVILDDKNDFFDSQKEHLFRTRPEFGLMSNDVPGICRLFTRLNVITHS